MAEIWNFLQSPANNAAFNMALDEALLHTAAQRKQPLLRVYRWEKAAVSFGYFQKFPRQLADRYEIVRRPTGGGLVYHGDGVDTTYTVIAPPAHRLSTMSTSDAYGTIHKAVAVAIGNQSQVTNHQSSLPRSNYECFTNPVPGDVVANGRKLAGGAQRRNKYGMLHQGSIALRVSAKQLAHGFSATFDSKLQSYSPTDQERSLADRLAHEKYATDAWNRRVS